MSSKFVGFYKENIEHMLLFIIAWIGDILVKSLHIYWYYQQHFEYNHQLEMFFELTLGFLCPSVVYLRLELM